MFPLRCGVYVPNSWFWVDSVTIWTYRIWQMWGSATLQAQNLRDEQVLLPVSPNSHLQPWAAGQVLRDDMQREKGPRPAFQPRSWIQEWCFLGPSRLSQPINWTPLSDSSWVFCWTEESFSWTWGWSTQVQLSPSSQSPQWRGNKIVVIWSH